MKSVVMISHWFPPESNAGVYRPLRFVRHLPAYGWQPVVIADDPYCYSRYDPGLLELVPPTTEVIRVRNGDPWNALQQRRTTAFREQVASKTPDAIKRVHDSHQRPLRSALRWMVRAVEPMIYRPDEAMFWIRPATEAAVQACSRTGAQVVWATGSPWSSLVVARNVSKRTGLPYVLDLRDSWTLSYNDFQQRQPEWIKGRDRRLVGKLFKDAQAVVIRYMSEAEAYWRRYPDALDPKRVHLIPNGYEGDIKAFESSRNERCTVLFTGFIGPYWYDTMLDALARLKQLEPAVARHLRLVFIGEETEAVAEIASRLGLSEMIEASGVMSFAEVNKLQSQADALLLLGWKPSPAHELGGSKIFGYLKARKPIIGILPQDEQTRILRSVGVQTIAHAGSSEEIIRAFKRLVSNWSTGRMADLLPDRAACEEYSAERQTPALVRAFEGLPAMNAFVPGLSPIPPSLEKNHHSGELRQVRPVVHEAGVNNRSSRREVLAKERD